MDFRYLLDKQLTQVIHPLPEEFSVLAMALESTNSGVIITDFRQPDNPIVFCNHAFENLTGYSREEILGKNCRFLQSHDRNQECLAPLREAILAGQNLTIELRNYHKNGKLFWNELSIAPVRNSDGEVTHFIGIQNDVTAKKVIEIELREQIDLLSKRLEKQAKYIKHVEEILANILESARECHVVLDASLKVIKANPMFYAIFTDDEENVIGQPFMKIHEGLWNNEGLHQLLTIVAAEKKGFDHYNLDLPRPKQDCERVAIKAAPLKVDGISKDFILVTINCKFARGINLRAEFLDR